MIQFIEIIKKLYPKGKAFNLFPGKQFEKLNKAFSLEYERVKEFYDQVRNSGIPGLIPDEALEDWENFLALETISGLTSFVRNSRIISKYAAQGGQGPGYIEKVLQDADFGVYVIENIPVQDPRPYLGYLVAGPALYETADKIYTFTLGNGDTLGSGVTLGAYSGISIIEIPYEIPADPALWWPIWFLTGPGGLGDFVNIPIERMSDFKKLIIQTKPGHTWIVAQVNFV